jgi:hypothetical protein
MSNVRIVYDEFIKAGYTPIQASAAVGRFQQESGHGLNTTVIGDKSIPGGSVGIMQANGDRQKALKQFGGENWTDPAVQARFAIHEMNTSEKNAGQMLRNAQDPTSAVNAMMAYERPQGYTANNPAAGHGYANTLANTTNLLGYTPEQMAALPSAQVQAAPAETASTGLDGLLKPAIDAQTAMGAIQGDPTAQAALAAGQDNSGLMALMQQAQAAQAQPVAAPVAMSRPNQQDNRTADEKLAAVSQTPNVYIDRMRRRTT